MWWRGASCCQCWLLRCEVRTCWTPAPSRTARSGLLVGCSSSVQAARGSSVRGWLAANISLHYTTRTGVLDAVRCVFPCDPKEDQQTAEGWSLVMTGSQ